MINLTAKVELNKDGGVANGVSLNNSETVNIASGISSAVGKHTQPYYNAFTLGKSRLGDGSGYSDNINYFISRYMSNGEGVFLSPFILTVTGSNIKYLTIVFNAQDMEYPKSLIVDGVEISDDDPRWEIEFAYKGNAHTIEIKNWNKPYSPLVITSIYADLSIEIDKTNLLYLNRIIADRQNMVEPVYGIISNYGKLEVADLDETILDLINQGVFTKKLEVDIYIKNTDINKLNQIAKYNIRQITYQNEDRKVSVEIKDTLEDWQKTNVPALYIDPSDIQSQTAKYYYDYLYQQTLAVGYDILSFNELDSDTQAVLNATTIEYPLLDGDTLWNEWEKLCNLCFLHIYCNNIGRIVVKYKKI